MSPSFKIEVKFLQPVDDYVVWTEANKQTYAVQGDLAYAYFKQGVAERAAKKLRTTTPMVQAQSTPANPPKPCGCKGAK